MSTPAHPTKNDRREQAKAAADALKAKQAQAAARQRTIAIAALVIGLVVVTGLVVFIINQGSASGAATGPQLTPAAASTHGGVVFDATGRLDPPSDDDGSWPQNLAADGGPVVVSVYFDFMCPWCGVFEQTQAETLNGLLAAGDIVLDSHPVAILDRYANGTAYSTRSASAAFAVAQGSPEHYADFLAAMMAEGTQPAENTDGLTNAEIAAIATEVGVPAEVVAEIESASYADYTAVATDLASQDLGQLSTPTVLINGEPLEANWTEEGALEAAILAAQG